MYEYYIIIIKYYCSYRAISQYQLYSHNRKNDTIQLNNNNKYVFIHVCKYDSYNIIKKILHFTIRSLNIFRL